MVKLRILVWEYDFLTPGLLLVMKLTGLVLSRRDTLFPKVAAVGNHMMKTSYFREGRTEVVIVIWLRYVGWYIGFDLIGIIDGKMQEQ